MNDNNKYPCQPVGADFLQTAPAVFRAEEIVPATAEQVFASFENADEWPLWASSILKVEWTSPKPFKVGTTRTVTLQGDLIAYEEFTAWEPGKHMAFYFTHTNKEKFGAFAEDYVVTDLGDGRSRVVWTVAMQQSGFGALLLFLGKPFIGLMFKRLLKNFRVHMQGKLAQNASA